MDGWLFLSQPPKCELQAMFDLLKKRTPALPSFFGAEFNRQTPREHSFSPASLCVPSAGPRVNTRCERGGKSYQPRVRKSASACMRRLYKAFARSAFDTTNLFVAGTGLST